MGLLLHKLELKSKKIKPTKVAHPLALYLQVMLDEPVTGIDMAQIKQNLKPTFSLEQELDTDDVTIEAEKVKDL